MQISVDIFISILNNHWCDWDGAFGNQCFDLAQFYNAAVIGNPTPFTGATADLIYQQPGSLYTQIPNTPDFVPQKGDVIVWKWPHVAIATGNNSTTSQFEAFEQNDPTGSNCHIKLYTNYDGVIGVLRPKTLPTGTFVDATTFTNLVTKASTYDEFVKIGYTTTNDITTRLNALQSALDNTNKQVGDLQKQNDALVLEVQQTKDALAKQADITQQQATGDTTAIDQGREAANNLKNVTNDINQVAGLLGVTYPPVNTISLAIAQKDNEIKALQLAQQQTVKSSQTILQWITNIFSGKRVK